MTTTNPSAYPPEHFGGLEVDTRKSPGAGNGGWNADDLAKFRVADQSPSSLPQVHSPDLPEVASYHGHDYSMPQAVNGADEPNGYAYQQGYYAPKENEDSPEVNADEAKGKKPGTICGMRRKVFWIVLAIAIIVVIAAAVGGGVGGSMAASNSSQQNGGGSSSSGSGSGSGGGNPGSGGSGGTGDSNNSTGAILPSTNIGSQNFTDQYGFDNHMVFFQLRSKQIWQSYWNSSTKVWTSADGKVEDTVKEGTPISNSMFWHSKTARDIRIYYLDENNKVMGQINGNPVYGLTWDKSGVSDTFTAAASSQLLSNGQYTADSYLSNLVLYQDASNSINVLRRTGGNTDWAGTAISTDFGEPAAGTGLAFIPIYTTDAVKKMNLFYVSTAGSLVGLNLTNDNDWTGQALPTKVETNASITAFSSGYNNTDLTIHVLATQTGKAPLLTTFSGGEWRSAGEVETMSGDDVPVKIAANQGGRVYGVVERGSSGVEIVEWEWTGGTTYNKLGAVNVVT